MAEKAKWRVGTKVPRNLYYGDEPVAMLATAELAQALAEKLNNAEYRVTLESALQSEREKVKDLTEQLAQAEIEIDLQKHAREENAQELLKEMQALKSEQQKRAELEAERARLKAELEKASDNRPLHMYVWSQKPSWIAVVQARSVAEARILILEQIGGGDGTCTVRDHAAEFVKANTPDIWHRPNAEFELTDSAEVIEQVAYCERLQAELQTERALRVQAETERDSLKEAVQIIAYEPHACGSNGAVIAQDCLARLNSRKGRDD